MEIFYFSKFIYQIVRKLLQNGQHEASTKTFQQLNNKKIPKLWCQKKPRKEQGSWRHATFSQGFVLPLPQTDFRAGQAS